MRYRIFSDRVRVTSACFCVLRNFFHGDVLQYNSSFSCELFERVSFFREFVINGTLDTRICLERGSIEVNEHGCCPWRQNHISGCFSGVFADSGDSVGVEAKD